MADEREERFREELLRDGMGEPEAFALAREVAHPPLPAAVLLLGAALAFFGVLRTLVFWVRGSEVSALGVGLVVAGTALALFWARRRGGGE